MGIANLVRRGAGPLLATALLLAFAPPSSAYRLRGGVVGAGATPAGGAANAAYAMLGTAGQSAVGASSNATWKLAHGYWSFGGARVVAVDPPGAGPAELSFGPAVPNPSRGDVRFELALPNAGMVRLVVLDVSGRIVDEAEGALPAGRHTLRWAGGTHDGRVARPGIYFARLLVDGRPFATRRVVELGSE